ncbi:hypothetical protein [Comamonas thiooxydans]|uniref:hypothetical protein n=1 Tax=Comamonas thiooxydans TaxID=363952 RepID=UPI000B4147E4|nr:hypothetical protein [Comamonas thiooxydans]
MAQHQPNFHKRLAVAGAIFISVTANLAHADAFTSGVSSQEVTAMRQRMDSLESQLSTMRQQQEQAKAEAEAASKRSNISIGPDGMPVAERAGMPGAKRAADLDPLAEPPYVVMGTINGHYLVKHGEKRHLLTPGELEVFEAKELAKAQARLLANVGQPDPPSAGVAKLPGPPPLPPLAAKPAATATPAKPAQAAPAPAAAPKPGQRAAQHATTTAK